MSTTKILDTLFLVGLESFGSDGVGWRNVLTEVNLSWRYWLVSLFGT